MCSGGFDPIHIGHLRLLQGARQRGRVLVALNSDAWLVRKKGYFCWPFEERRELLLALQPLVEVVVPTEDADGTVCDVLREWQPHFFANGGDRNLNTSSAAEYEVCQELGIVMLWGVGGGKVRSSSELVRRG